MDATFDKETAASGDLALRRIAEREEILEICYWYQGEGFGDRFTAQAVSPFLNWGEAKIGAIMAGLAAEGALVSDGPGYRLSDGGRKAAGRLFHDTFTEFQLGTHGECTAGCCDSEAVCDHEQAGGHAHGHQHIK